MLLQALDPVEVAVVHEVVFTQSVVEQPAQSVVLERWTLVSRVGATNGHSRRDLERTPTDGQCACR